LKLQGSTSSGDYVVFAGCTKADLGIDIMKVELRRNTTLDKIFSLMNRQFTEREWRFINNTGTPARTFDPSAVNGRLFNFYRLWCLKESYVKAIGTGIKFGLQRIEFIPGCIVEGECKGTTMQGECRGTTVYVDSVLQEGWVFCETVFDGHIMALAVRGGEEVGVVEKVEFSDLVTVENSDVAVRYFNEFNVKKEVP